MAGPLELFSVAVIVFILYGIIAYKIGKHLIGIFTRYYNSESNKKFCEDLCKKHLICAVCQKDVRLCYHGKLNNGVYSPPSTKSS